MTRAYIGIGSNIAPAENVKSAVLALDKEVRLIVLSTIYQTQPEHGLEQSMFYNGIALIETDLSPDDLKFQVLRAIETRLGRQRCNDKNAPRTIDLDLLLYGDLIIHNEELTIPDPGIATRPVLAIPLRDLAPHLVPPGMGDTISALAEALPLTSMEPLHAYTAQLRKCL